MPWQNQGGGSGGGPWGGGQSPWSRGGGGKPPDLEDILRRGQDRFRRLLPGGWGSGRGVVFVLVALVLVWLASGIYFVQPDQVGIVLRFGAFNRKTTPGANYHLPYPIETVLTPSVTRVNTIEIGELGAPGEGGLATGQEPQEARMLTGDENLLNVYFTVQYVVKDAPKFLFNIRNPDETVKAVAESAMREVIGHTPVTDAIVGGDKIASETQALLQRILDEYQSGVQITSVNLRRIDLPSPDVIAAFADVQNAKTERDSKIIQAKTYSNNILPRAKGEAAQIVQAAEAYRQQVVLHAEGDASRFLAVYQAYKQAPDVTAQRLYIETMESILDGANKVILDKGAAQAGVLPYLPLPALRPPAPPANRASASAGAAPQQ
ncbi:MAG TPA: FtsH protease activity modulator HflK [Stellaceae bacterium]|jgi:membrane protease subunit HflK|nr:FtsH protease activity modulator HflK [Stellaceae bacterium]